MPIYEYVCDACGHNLEAIQKISEDPLVNCPSCEKDALRKKISAAGFRLKGGGWYETDFKSGKKKNVGASDASKSASNDTSAGKEKSSSDSATGSSESSSKSSESSSSDNGSKSTSSAND